MLNNWFITVGEVPTDGEDDYEMLTIVVKPVTKLGEGYLSPGSPFPECHTLIDFDPCNEPNDCKCDLLDMRVRLGSRKDRVNTPKLGNSTTFHIPALFLEQRPMRILE